MTKKTPIKGKKVGKTVTFQAKPKVDPFAVHQPNHPLSNDPLVCQCGDLDCPTTRSLQSQWNRPPKKKS